MRSKPLHRDYTNLFPHIARLVDISAVILSAFVVFVLPQWPAPLNVQNYQLAVLIGTLLVLIVFPLFNVYRSWRGRGWLVHIRTIAIAWMMVIMLLIFIAFITKTSALYSRQWLILWSVTGFGSLIGSRLLLGQVIKYLRLQGWNHKRIIVLGAGKLGRRVARQIRESNNIGYDIVAFFDDNGELHGREFDGIPVKGNIDQVPTLLAHDQVDEVWITLPMRAEQRLAEILHDLRHSTAAVRFVPDIFNLHLINHSIAEIAGMPVLNLSESPIHGINAVAKFIEDKILASIILVLISPLMMVIAIGVKLTSPGPVFYRQERVSWNGRRFMMLKFRTMPVDAENNTGPVWAKAGEQRATKLGMFLRRTSLDELPQFINVLRGDMSIVGPRPERPVFVGKFKDEVPHYMKKHLVKAGITGWAQVNGWRGDTDINKRIEYDIQYIENWSVWFDLRIIFLTLLKGFIHKNAY